LSESPDSHWIAVQSISASVKFFYLLPFILYTSWKSFRHQAFDFPLLLFLSVSSLYYFHDLIIILKNHLTRLFNQNAKNGYIYAVYLRQKNEENCIFIAIDPINKYMLKSLSVEKSGCKMWEFRLISEGWITLQTMTQEFRWR
jgi:hypothetical protein